MTSTVTPQVDSRVTVPPPPLPTTAPAAASTQQYTDRVPVNPPVE